VRRRWRSRWPSRFRLPPTPATRPPSQTAELDKVEVVGKADDYVATESSTATKTPTPLRDTPQSITVVTQQLIRDQAMSNMADVVRYVPGVTMAQGEGNRDTPVLRGNSSTSDMYVDGMRDDVQYLRDLYNIDRVEALKGPNAMIFGRGGSGGVINRVSKQPNWKTVREVSGQFGSWDKRRIAADVGQAINDASAFRITGVFEDSDSYRDEYNVRRWGVNPTYSVSISDNTAVTVGYEHFEDDRVADRGQPSEADRVQRSPHQDRCRPVRLLRRPDRSDVTAYVDALTALVEHDFAGGASLRNRTRIANYDKFYQNIFPGAGHRGAHAGEPLCVQQRHAAHQRLQPDDVVWNASTGSVKHTLLAGAEVGHQDNANLRHTGYFGAAGSTATSVLVPLDNPRYTGPIDWRQSATDARNHSVANVGALYVQDQLEFSPQWQAIVGVRFDHFSVDFTNERLDSSDPNANLSSTDNLWSPRAGVVYKPTEPVSIYASYSIAYQPRAGEQLASLSPTNKAFDPEKFTNYEIGAKWDINPTLAFTAAVYQLERTNVVVPSATDPTISVLVDGQRAKGVEVGLAGSLATWWHVMGGYAWQDGEVLAGADKGKRLAQLPQNTFSLWNRFDCGRALGVGFGRAVPRRDVRAADQRGDGEELHPLRCGRVLRRDATPLAAVQHREPVRQGLRVRGQLRQQHPPGSPRAAHVSLRYEF
jgi:catecholate siderophore receptor